MKLDQRERAILFAAFKALESQAKAASGNCEIAPGSNIDVSGETVTITIPKGWNVTREAGDNGIIEKTATQNAYGLSVIALMMERLGRFNQDGVILDAIVGAIEAALTKQVPTADELRQQQHPQLKQLEQAIETVKARIPKRKEPTARKLDKPRNSKPTIKVG